MKPPAPLEREILTACMDYLRAMHFYCWRNNTGAIKVGTRYIRYGALGSPDIIGLLPGGQWFGVEVKRPGKQPTPAQVAFAAAIVANGGLYVVAHSVEELRAALKQFKIHA